MNHLICQKYYRIAPLRKTWNRICANNNQIKPTQYFDYYYHLFSSFYCNPKKVIRWRFVFYYISDGNNECIIPFIENRKKKIIRGVSNYGRLDYEDILASTNSVLFIQESLQTVFVNYLDYRIDIKNINEDSLYFSAWGDSMVFHENCVKIQLPDNYDDYIESLSKHQRQNIRTAYNKLDKGRIHIEVIKYDNNNQINRRLWNTCEKLYEKRHDSGDSLLSKWYIRFTNPYHYILSKGDNYRIMVLLHNNVPLAYMAGLIDLNNKCFYIPRLCINEDYLRFSPGIILIVETIKSLIEEGISYLDLMQGDEQYKLAMGGIINKNYSLKCHVEVLFHNVYTCFN